VIGTVTLFLKPESVEKESRKGFGSFYFQRLVSNNKALKFESCTHVSGEIVKDHFNVHKTTDSHR